MFKPISAELFSCKYVAPFMRERIFTLTNSVLTCDGFNVTFCKPKNVSTFYSTLFTYYKDNVYVVLSNLLEIFLALPFQVRRVL